MAADLGFILILSLLNGLAVSIIFYVINKYFLKRRRKLKRSIWVGVIVAVITFVISVALILILQNNNF